MTIRHAFAGRLSAGRWARRLIALMASGIAAATPAAAAEAAPRPPAALARRLPGGFEVLSVAQVRAGRPGRRFFVVALARRGADRRSERPAPARPLLVFEQRGADFAPAGRNDRVVLKADEGGQCDPFLDGGAVIAAKGRYFTVQNGVACGEHWTDYVTFRLDDRTGGFVFDNERVESWTLNPRDDGDALVRDGPPRVTRPPPGAAVAFSAWRPAR